MKSILMLLATGFLALSVTTSHAQTRDFGAQRLIVDDGLGGKLTAYYPGPGNATFTFGPGTTTTVEAGTTPGQTLAWDGISWTAMNNLLNDGTDVTIPTGNLTVSTGIITGTFNGSFTGNITGDGSALTNLNATNIMTGTLSDARLSSNVALLNANNTFTGTNTFGIVHGTDFFGIFTGAFSGNGFALTNLNATNIIGTLSDARLSSNVPLLNANNTFTGTNTFGTVSGTNFVGGTFAGAFIGNGFALTNLNAANIIGTLSDARLSSNVPLLNANNTFTGTNTFGIVHGTDFFGIFTGAFSGNGFALTNLNATNIASGTLTLARISTAGALANQVLTFNGANLVYAPPAASSLIHPFSQTVSNPSVLFSLTNADDTTGGVAAFSIINATNSSVALTALTTGSGDALAAITTGSGRAIYALTSGSSTGIAGMFENVNPANASPTVRSFTNGTGTAGSFEITNGASTATTLSATTAGTGIGISSTGGNGVQIASGTGGIALNMVLGRLIASYVTSASNPLPNDAVVINVNDGAGGSTPNVTLPAGTNGQIAITSSDDPDGAVIDGVAHGATTLTVWVYTAGVWKRVP